MRLEWGPAGHDRLAPAEVTVIIDVLADTDSASDRIAEAAAAAGSLVLRGGLRNASAIADAAVAEQHRRAERTSIAVIACGGVDADGTRFAVEDLLGAGAVIDALAVRGIDHTSPEAAVACEAFRGLRPAVRHLLTASGTGQAWVASGRREEVLAAASLDAQSPSQ